MTAGLPLMGQLSGCDISNRQLPEHGHLPELPGPDSGLRLKYITLGVGTQNYTCHTGAAKPVPIGAVATLYDASCLADRNPQVIDLINMVALHYPKISTNWIVEKFLKMTILGQHYFTGTKPFFDLSTRGGSDKAFVSVVANVPAPNKKDVPWLRLDKTEGSGITAVFRVITHEGTSPATCLGMAPSFQVGYTAQYWVYG
ncbi:hypothetical protein FQN49_008349 [Arthroderma sp. PD_2]|nr:hypothetical protein FQN49_008349 [Arthroderma sp. PD_2]